MSADPNNKLTQLEEIRRRYDWPIRLLQLLLLLGVIALTYKCSK